MVGHTDDRIRKLFSRGLSLGSIARKIGRPGDIRRVLRALPREVSLEREDAIREAQRQEGLLASEAAERFDRGC